MKQHIFVAVLLLTLACNSGAKERVIKCPSVGATNSTSIEIEEITLSDTATILNIKAFYRPNSWIRIASGSYLKGNNKNYPLRYGVGITPGKEFWLPESGKGEFQLIFPPLPEEVTSIDFSEGETEGAFKIWGIQLNNKLPKLNLPKDIDSGKLKLTELPTPKIKNGKAILEGKVLNYIPGTIDNLSCYLKGCVEKELSIKVDDDGSFALEVPTLNTTPAELCIGYYIYQFFLAPGEKTQLFINQREITRSQSRLRSDQKKKEESIYYGGYMAELSKKISDIDYPTNIISYDLEFHRALENKTPEEVKAYFLVLRDEKLKEIANNKVVNESKAYKEYLQYSVETETAWAIMNIPITIYRTYVIQHKLDTKQANEYIENNPIILPDTFFNVLKNLPLLNKPKAVYTTKYGELINNNQLRQAYKRISETDNQGTYFELATVSPVLNQINAYIPATEEQLNQIASLGNPAYINFIEESNQKALEAAKKQKFTINEVGNISNEDLYSSIISKYKGHTLLIDIWATWCGPCRAAHKTILPLKEELKDKGIIYIYLTGETSPLGTWLNMIPDIHGEHFRLTSAQLNSLMQTFNTESFPTYRVVDGNGNTTYQTTMGFPGIDKMKEELLKAANQK